MGERDASQAGEDELLAADFCAGRRSGLDAAYRAYGKLLYSAARNVLGADGEAEDCVHDTLLRIWQRGSAYRPEGGSLRSYLLVSVRNDALTRKRAAARHLRIEQSAFRSDSAYEPELDDPVERARLKRALAALPLEQKAALELAYFGELTHVQVAERIGAPLGTVKSRIALALRKLNSALSEKGASTP